jgi:glycosyltransferase involved in cell wall biosynthesis
VIATHNEQGHIERAIRGVLCGSVDWRSIEVVVADGGSTDGTGDIVRRLAEEFPGSVRLVDNPQRFAPAGFNVGLLAARGTYLCILSAHGSVDRDYFRVCLDKLDNSDVDAVGGALVALPFNDSLQAKMMVALLSSRFGVGASFRNQTKEGPVDTITPGLFRRRVFEKYGLFDERLVRNQDNELSSRLITGGGQIHLIPRIKSYYRCRRDLGKLLYQCYANGLYAILTWRVNPRSFRLRHGAPMFFLLFLLCGGAMSMVNPLCAWPYLGLLGFYGVLAVAASIQSAMRFRMPQALVFPVLFFLMHVTYGIGTIFGIFRFGLCKLAPNRVQKLPQQLGQ